MSTSTTFALECSVATPDGAFRLIVDPEGRVLASGWNTTRDALVNRIHPSIRPDAFQQGEPEAADAVRAYYAGDRHAVTAFPVRQHGTELQRLGWSVLRTIPAGQPVDYAEFARRIERPGAARAAAAICARNAVGLFTPCHRVVRADGTLGGFAWGLEVKRSLLAREDHPVG